MSATDIRGTRQKRDPRARSFMAEMKVRPERMFEVAPAEFRANGADAASDSDGCDGGEFSDEKKN